MTTMNALRRTLRTLTVTTAALAGVAMGMTMHTTDEVSVSTVAAPRMVTMCATEDAPGPCVWDAGRQGNGKGRSFVRGADQRVRYLAPAPPKHGYVRTSTGRTVKVDTRNGCFTLTPREARVRKVSADPGDGMIFCER